MRSPDELIPGGAHTYAKGDDQFPTNAPRLIERGKGCRVWDSVGREFIEYNMGLRAVTLGHAYPEVVDAVREQIGLGCNYTRPSRLESACAEKFLELVPTMEMVKFCKDGSTAVDGAIRLARAHTGRGLVAMCGDHPFYSTSDWFIGTTAMPAGIPAATRALVHAFKYNDLDSVRSLFERFPQQFACVILEPARTDEPAPGYLAALKALCEQHGVVLIFDEMITGFRWHRSGAQHVYGVTPHLSAFGKALANGFSVSALAGCRDLMELGGLKGRPRVFLLSTTHGAETHSLAAAIATMSVYQRRDVTGFLHRQGARLRAGVNGHIARLGLEHQFSLFGRDCCLFFATRDGAGNPSQGYRTLFLQELVRHGTIAPAFVVSYSHDDGTIDQTIEAVGRALEIYRRALQEGLERFLEGRSVRPVFRPAE